MRLTCSVAIALLVASIGSASAETGRITADTAEATFTIDGQTLRIGRAQDPEARLEDEFAKNARACPPFCVHPMSAGEGVETVGELELIDFLRSHVETGRGLLIDSRVPEWFAKGTIPGAVNLPFTALDPENRYRDEILKALGGRERDGGWDFSGATDLLMFCNGPWCDQSPRAIASLRAVGYPAEKLRYYRGGMQVWQVLGLTVTKPEKAS